jgi:cbb3-type cytochrome oxidase maturation protein
MHAESETAIVVLTKAGRCLATFRFEDRLRSGAREAVAALTEAGFAVKVLSGDREEPVRPLASARRSHYSTCRLRKATYIASMEASGRKVLMVGDGLNDAPALVASHASMAPASAADVGRNAADLVFLRESLLSVPQAVTIARNAKRLVRENLAIAVGYNAIAMPIAILGYNTAECGSGRMSVVIDGGCQCLRLCGDRRKAAQTIRAKQSSLATICAGGRGMTDFFYLIPLALALGVVGLTVFLWSLKSGQYEDLEGAAVRILFSEDDRPIVRTQQQSSSAEDEHTRSSSTN